MVYPGDICRRQGKANQPEDSRRQNPKSYQSWPGGSQGSQAQRQVLQNLQIYRSMKTHTFLRKVWRIVRAAVPSNCQGYCESPNTKGRKIVLPPDLSEQELLTYCVHESLHACFWWLDEEFVTDAAADIGRFLWRMGFRLKERG